MLACSFCDTLLICMLLAFFVVCVLIGGNLRSGHF